MRRLIPVFLIVLVVFVLIGFLIVPFHGDESTIIHMSGDWFRLAKQGNFEGVAFRNPPPNASYQEQQELRLLNGVTSKYLIGLGWSLWGSQESLPNQWAWGADWEFNLTTNRIPGTQVLLVARITSALCAALSVLVVFQIGSHLVGWQTGAWSALIYALLPVVLVNGRRAMFEGAFLLALGLLIWACLIAAQRIKRGQQLWAGWLLVGASAGLALATKHTAVLVVIPAFLGLLVIGRRDMRGTLMRAGAAGVLALALFMALNPAWWSSPLGAAREVLRLRTSILQIQVDLFGAYTNIPDRLIAPFTSVFGSAQYFEDPRGWGDWVGEQIKAYEGSGLAGLAPGALTGGALLLIGAAILFLRYRDDPSPLIPLFGWLTLTLMGAIVITNPLPWARYYLPLAPLFSVIAGAGLYFLLTLVTSPLRTRRV